MEEVDPNARALLNRPYLYDDLIDVWEGFANLSATRSVGMSVNPIPISEMVSYWRDIKGVTGSALQDKVELTRSMDIAFMAYAARKETK